MTSQNSRGGPEELRTIWILLERTNAEQGGEVGTKKHVGYISQGSLYLWHTHDREHNR